MSKDGFVSWDGLNERVVEWARARGIFVVSNPQAQLLKTLEELGETAGALAKGNHEGVIDGVGDVLVTLILFAHIHGFTLQEALEAAYDEIKDRKGSMKDGVFVKAQTG